MSPTASNDTVHETCNPERLPGARQYVYALGFFRSRAQHYAGLLVVVGGSPTYDFSVHSAVELIT